METACDGADDILVFRCRANALNVDAKTGLLAEARQCPSPNCDLRPDGAKIELIVIHGISLPPGEFGGPWIDRLFSNSLESGTHPYFSAIQALKVSAHALVKRDGAVVQYVPFHQRAWHAGHSSFHGRVGCNDFSVGIELEGTDDIPYDPRQYECLARLLKALWIAYPEIPRQNLAGHSDIAPGRKTDPGPAFDWGRLRALLDLSSTT